MGTWELTSDPRRLRAMLGSVEDPVSIGDRDGGIQIASRRALAVTTIPQAVAACPGQWYYRWLGFRSEGASTTARANTAAVPQKSAFRAERVAVARAGGSISANLSFLSA